MAGRIRFGPPLSNHIVKAETVELEGRSARAGMSRRCLLSVPNVGSGRRGGVQAAGTQCGMLLALFCGALACGRSLHCPADDQSGNGTIAPTMAEVPVTLVPTLPADLACFKSHMVAS